ncbi:tyrosine-type recombinase/integrase [Streptomyces sp. NPDC054775]
MSAPDPGARLSPSSCDIGPPFPRISPRAPSPHDHTDFRLSAVRASCGLPHKQRTGRCGSPVEPGGKARSVTPFLSPPLTPAPTGDHWPQGPDQDLIFSSAHGGMIGPVGFSRTFDRLVRRAGVRRITVRLARHTCGTLFALLKVHSKVAQAIIRHSRISMTVDVYMHVVGEDEREAVALPAELLEDPLIG